MVDTIARTTVLGGGESNSFVAVAEQVRLEPVPEHRQRRR